MLTIDPAKLTLKKGDSVLDLGCGDGRHIAHLLSFDGITAVGADIRLASLKNVVDKIEVHKELGLLGKSRRLLIQSDIRHLPFPDKCFDAVVLSEVLEHLEDDETALTKINRILKPNGVFAVSVPTYFPEKICWLLSKEYTAASDGHVRIYREKTLRNRLMNAGFIMEGKGFAHALHTPYWWLKCLLNPHDDDYPPVKLYHRFLVWDMMKSPLITRFLERLLNPVLGKSLILYTRKVK